MLDTGSFLLGIAAGGGGGGDNPNYAETIEGTVANPWGDYTFTDIVSEIGSNTADYKLSFEATHPTLGTFTVSNMPIYIDGNNLSLAYDERSENGRYIFISWNTNGISALEIVFFDGTSWSQASLKSLAGAVTADLQRNYHPMP